MPRKNIRMERGERLQLARQRAGLSQSFVAEQLGVSRQLIGSWEKGGNITVDQLGQLCVLYGCAPAFVMFGTPEESTEPQAQHIAALPQPLRGQLWMLYQVFLREGAATDLARAPSL